ncbi:TRAP transporter small permease [Yersinia pestis]|uniref:TRAP transporter small permease n=1 Tax=Yersinia pestis TaxID=632 RepID=UPI0006276B0E|nr:TRAP transporter small permease [Yersinia pestis]KKM59276.1 C4-dicarboxylate ABC transporter [Yersinia pestis]
MARYYLSAMDVLYRLSIWVAGIALIIMVAAIPIGIFARYIQNDGLSWPEPVAILCMVTFTSIGAAASYRSGSHIAVSMVTDRIPEAGKKICALLVNLLMVMISLFILSYSYILCSELWSQPVAEFPLLTAGQTYLPLPVGSAITLMFIIERLFFGPQTQRPVVMIGNS